MFSSRNLVQLQQRLQTRTTSAILSYPRRYEGTYPYFKSAAVKMTKENDIMAGENFLDETEVQTRMSQVLHNYRLFNLHSLDWDASFESLGLDIYE